MSTLHKLLAAPAATLLSATLLFGIAGCKTTSAPADDSSLTSSVQGRIGADGTLTGLPIQAGVEGGIATLTGSVSNDAQRELAARDAAQVPGIRTVVNNLTVQPATATATIPPPPPLPVINTPAPKPAPIKPVATVRKPLRDRTPAPIEHAYAQPPAPEPPPPPLAPVPEPVAPPPPPPPPPAPVSKTMTLEAGTTIPVRITQTLDSATTQQGSTFSGAVASDIVVEGVVVIAQGSTVTGRVDEVQEAAHFKGNSLLTVSLTAVKRYPVTTEAYSVTGKGRGKNTAEKAGVGAIGGAILGGILGGGKGAAIGAAAGGAGGAGINAVTRGEQVQIPSESIVRFRTSTSLAIKVGPAKVGELDDLQRRNNQ